jgi:4,5:9,10-diseco-3-hydroxy-5,9,17-trioxoandrosta-1(10),2-diene-4-oate hydrolase
MTPAQDRYIQVGKIKARYWAEGSQGSSVVLIHGLGGYIENWLPSFGAFSAAHRVYAFDLPGHGLTDKPADAPYTVEFFAEFVRDFMAALNLERAHIIGHSLGGAVSAQFAIRQPEMVETLTLVSSAGLGQDTDVATRLLTIPMLGETLARPSRSGVATFLKNLVHDPSLINDQMLDFHLTMATPSSAQAAFFKTLRANANLMGQKNRVYNFNVGGLASFTRPVFILWGREDPVVPVAHGESLAQRVRGARLKIFEQCKHIPALEHSQTFNEAVLEFLSGSKRKG